MPPDNEPQFDPVSARLDEPTTPEQPGSMVPPPLVPTVGPDAYTFEWFAMRRQVVGASEAAAVCGMSQYATPLDLYMEKTGLIKPQPAGEAAEMGLAAEPFILSCYEKRTGIVCERPLPMYRHWEHPFMAATPDARWKMPFGNRLVELKLTGDRGRIGQLGPDGSDFIPDDWFLQCQDQMFVMDTSEMDLAVLHDARLRVFTIGRDDEICQRIVAAAGELMERIKNSDPPEPDFEHPQALELVKRMYSVKEGCVCDIDAATAVIWTEHQRLGTEIKKLDTARTILKARVLHAMGGNAIGRLPRGEQELVRQWMPPVDVAAFTRKGHSRLRQRKVKD